MGRRVSTSPILLALGAVVLVGLGLLIGVLVEGGDDDSDSGALQAAAIGDATTGRQLFVSQGCVMCHSYQGRGGSDAPSLDFMRGKLTATEIADMSGIIWNHVPTMKAAFAEEGIPFPTFKANEMANLIAYLHGGGPPPNVPESAMHDEEGGEHMEGSEHSHEEGSEHGGEHMEESGQSQ